MNKNEGIVRAGEITTHDSKKRVIKEDIYILKEFGNKSREGAVNLAMLHATCLFVQAATFEGKENLKGIKDGSVAKFKNSELLKEKFS